MVLGYSLRIVIRQLQLLQEEFRLPKLTFHSDLRRREASRRALPRTYSFTVFLHLLRFLSVPRVLHSMGHLIKSLTSVCVCLSVCPSACHCSNGRNSHSILMKLCTVVWNPKTKIEFVRRSRSDHSFPYFPHFSPHNAF